MPCCRMSVDFMVCLLVKGVGIPDRVAVVSKSLMKVLLHPSSVLTWIRSNDHLPRSRDVIRAGSTVSPRDWDSSVASR